MLTIVTMMSYGQYDRYNVDDMIRNIKRECQLVNFKVSRISLKKGMIVKITYVGDN